MARLYFIVLFDLIIFSYLAGKMTAIVSINILSRLLVVFYRVFSCLDYHLRPQTDINSVSQSTHGPSVTPCNRRERSFDSAGPRLWNNLRDDITAAASLPAFRRKLKTPLFRL